MDWERVGERKSEKEFQIFSVSLLILRHTGCVRVCLHHRRRCCWILYMLNMLFYTNMKHNCTNTLVSVSFSLNLYLSLSLSTFAFFDWNRSKLIWLNITFTAIIVPSLTRIFFQSGNPAKSEPQTQLAPHSNHEVLLHSSWGCAAWQSSAFGVCA